MPARFFELARQQHQIKKDKLSMDQRVEGLLAEVLQVSPSVITENVAMKDLEAWDSLKHMELIVSLEQNFDLQLSFDEIVAMRSVSEIKSALRARGIGV